jgi:hypothetical protein
MLQYALCAGFFVLGFVARDLLLALLSKRVLKRMNRRMKRGGVNAPGRSRAVLKPRPSDAPRAPGPSERAIGLFGASDSEQARAEPALDASAAQPR